MNVAIRQSIHNNVYVENDYQGNLSEESLALVNSLPWEKWFQIWLDSLRTNTELPNECELSLRLTSDRQIQEYNHQYRQFNNPTDVLAFAALESSIVMPEKLDEPTYLGDIIISLDTAQRQAIEQKHALEVELAWLSTHGLLHLLGWDHPDDDSLQAMLKRQSELIHSLNVFNHN